MLPTRDFTIRLNITGARADAQTPRDTVCCTTGYIDARASTDNTTTPFFESKGIVQFALEFKMFFEWILLSTLASIKIKYTSHVSINYFENF